jgi:glycosyltransferase involved in cell wall biosynthesis
MAKLFIGMPVRNGERHIISAINSLLAQTFTDFTIFVSDNESTDNTAAIVQRFAGQDSRVVYYRQPKDLGMFGNFEYVLKRADSEYFMWAAHDDMREREYLQVCIDALDANKNLGLATTATTIIDSLGRTLVEEHEVESFSDNSILMQVIKYTLMAEGLGKANIFYGVWRTEAARIVWDAYPQRRVWGQDYHVALALVARYQVHIDPRPMFRKIPTIPSGHTAPVPGSIAATLSFYERNIPVPLRNFKTYLAGHMEALRGTPYSNLVKVLMYMRLPHVFWVYTRERNYKRFFGKLIAGSKHMS